MRQAERVVCDCFLFHFYNFAPNIVHTQNAWQKRKAASEIPQIHPKQKQTFYCVPSFILPESFDFEQIPKAGILFCMAVVRW